MRRHITKAAAAKGTPKQRQEVEKLGIRIGKDIAATVKKEPDFSKYLASVTVSSYTRQGNYPGVPQTFVEKQAFYLLVIEMLSNGGYKEWYVNNWRDWVKARNGLLKQLAKKNRTTREFERVKKLAAKINGDIDKRGLRVWKSAGVQHRMLVEVKRYLPGVKYRGVPKDKIANGAYHVLMTTTPAYKRTWYLHGWKEYLAARKQLERLVEKGAKQIGFASVLSLVIPDEFDDLIALVGKKALETRAPGPSSFPAGITDRGKKIWKEIFETHKDTIFSTDDPKMQWKLAVMTYRRAAEGEGIKPFKSEQKILKTVIHKTEQREDHLERIITGDVAHLKKVGLIGGQRPKKLPGDVGYEKDKFYAGSVRKFKLKKGKLPIDVMDELKANRHYAKGKNGRAVSKDVSNMSYAMWLAPVALRRGESVELYTYLYFTQEDLISLLGRIAQRLPAKKLVEVLGRINKLWLKNKDLAKSAKQMRII